MDNLNFITLSLIYFKYAINKSLHIILIKITIN